MSRGVARTTDTGGLPPSMLDAVRTAGGLWRAGDYYASPETIVTSAHEHRVRALRLDARDLSFLPGLRDLEFLHLRSDGRPVLDPITNLKGLRGLVIDTGALRGTLNLAAHPRLDWLRIKLSGKGGAENVPHVLAGHPDLQHLQLNEVPFTTLTDVAAAFPSLRFLSLHGADRMRALGDLSAWRDTLVGMSITFAALRSLNGIQPLKRIEYVGLTYGGTESLQPLAALASLRYVQMLVRYPTLAPLAHHKGIRIAGLTMPEDEDLSPLRTWPALVALMGERWIGRPIDDVPLIDDMSADDPLRLEWDRARHG